MGLHGSVASRTASNTNRHANAARTQRTSTQFATRGGLLLAMLAAAGVTGSMPLVTAQATSSPAPVVASARVHAGAITHLAAAATPAVAPAAVEAAQLQPVAPVIAFADTPRALIKFDPDDRYYEQLRARMRWEPIRLGDKVLQTPDSVSRVLLAQSAASKARLAEVGLGWRDVYGIINAETSWIPRVGSSKDGTPNLGIAQFEPATARALGLRNPEDPVEAVHAMALHLKEAAEWSAKRLSGLKLSRTDYALKLREGLSIYYNLSSKGRSVWNGNNTAKLPVETQRHIANARRGRLEADELADQLASVRARTRMPSMMTAGFNSPNS